VQIINIKSAYQKFAPRSKKELKCENDGDDIRYDSLIVCFIVFSSFLSDFLISVSF
jgi:hypothetical protein